MSNKLEEQSAIYGKIVGALIESTPENWYSFTLKLSMGESGFSHQVISNEGHQDIVTPSEGVYASSRELQLYQERILEPLKSAEFKTWLDDNDNWKYEADFEYEA